MELVRREKRRAGLSWRVSSPVCVLLVQVWGKGLTRSSAPVLLLGRMMFNCSLGSLLQCRRAFPSSFPIVPLQGWLFLLIFCSRRM